MTATEYPAPRFNHVAMSVPSDLLDEEHRALLTQFYGEVFGFEEHAMLTVDRKRLVLGAGMFDQFVFLIANDDPMTCPRLDHWGMSVQSEEQLDCYLERARQYREHDARVDIVDKQVEDYNALALKSFYVAYLLPLMLEVQYYDFKDPERAAANS